MGNKKIKLSGMMFAGMIIVICFVYAINVQPVVFGKTCSSFTSQRLNQFDSYIDSNDFLYKSYIRFSNFYREPLIRSDKIINDEYESKFNPIISNFYRLSDIYIKISELNNFVIPVIFNFLSDMNIIINHNQAARR